ncbi:MAG: branched-chain alpha-keto acid dehydrogenase subunit E2, partial [Armatimonadetes bacterium OLB18]
MGIIEEGNGQASAKAEPKAEPEQAAPQPAEAREVTPQQPQQPEPTSEREGQRKWYSPVVRSIAKQKGFGIGTRGHSGRGASGRVTKKDLEDYLASGRKAAVRPAAPLGLDKAPADLKAGPGQ